MMADHHVRQTQGKITLFLIGNCDLTMLLAVASAEDTPLSTQVDIGPRDIAGKFDLCLNHEVYY